MGASDVSSNIRGGSEGGVAPESEASAEPAAIVCADMDDKDVELVVDEPSFGPVIATCGRPSDRVDESKELIEELCIAPPSDCLC